MKGVKRTNAVMMHPNQRTGSVCYDLKLKVLSSRTTLVLSNTRELDKVPKTK